VLFCAVVSDSETASALGVAFCGDNVRATSVLLHADVCEPADIEKCLLRLGTSGAPVPGKSVGLMFACTGRGYHFYDGTVGVESGIFKRLYPRVPLLGFFGNGEIGYDFPVESDGGSSMDGTSPVGAGDGIGEGDAAMPQIYHSFTTVFVLLTLLS